MNELKPIIDEYCSALSSIGWVLPDLAFGNDPTDVLAVEGLKPIKSIIDFFQWQDGIVEEDGQTVDQIYLFPGYYLISLKEAIVTYQILVGSDFYPAGLFPILASGGGDYYLIDLRLNSETSGAVYELLTGYFPALVFSDISRLFKTYKKCIDENIIYIDEGKYLEIRDK